MSQRRLTDMRKLESIYKAMKWDSVDYINTTVLTSKNNKDSRAFCLLPEEDTLTALKRVFSIKDCNFDEKFGQACSGSGQEERRISTLHSSSLCALLFFYNVTEKHPLKIEIKNVGEVTFFDVIFEYQNCVIEDSNPSNMDVTLLGKCQNKNVILFLESKFSEYITGMQKCLHINSAYLKEEISRPIYENWPWDKKDDESGQEFSVSVSESPAYLGGLKQMISHYVGVRKFERGIQKLKQGRCAGKDLYNVVDNAKKQLIQEKLRKFALERETVIVLGSILFNVYANDVTHTELQEYEMLYKKLMKQISEAAVQSGSDLHILDNFFTYQQLFKNKKEWMTKQICDFYYSE